MHVCIVWDDCSEQNCQVLENCHLRAARIITGAKNANSHDKLYAETQWPELEERRSYFKLCFMHKVGLNIFYWSILKKPLDQAPRRNL